MHASRSLSTVVVLTLAIAAFACSSETPSAARAERTAEPSPLFIISIDTLRADRLPLHGYEAGRTPNIDSFRNDAILFRRAYGSVPLTLPSHASLMTGLQPYRHGVRDNIGYGLTVEHPTLATILGRSGYATGAAVSSFVLRGETGISEGFSFYDDLMKVAPQETMSSWQRDGDETREILESWLDSQTGDRIFGFLHLYEPHTPYSPPEPYASDFADPYDGEIAYADSIVGRFLDTLREKGLYEKSTIVVLSDHGEGLGDHGELEHGVFVYRESIQVPLLIKLPYNVRAGEENTDVVSLVDLAPTLLLLVGVELPDGLHGADVLSGDFGQERSVYAESYYPRLHYGWHELHALIDADHHFIDAPAVELYATSDKAQLSNVAEENRRVVASMREEIGTILSSHPFEEPSVANPEDVRKLEALGYLGSAAPTSGALPDPKEKVALLETFGRAAGYFQRGEYNRAIEIARGIVHDNPGFLQGWGLLSSAYRKQGNLSAAVGALEEQMRQSPGNPQTALALSSLLLDMRRYEEARTHAELVVEYSPSLAHETMASIALAKGDLVQAEADARKSLEAAPLRVQPLVILSQVAHAEKRVADELELLDRVHQQVEAKRVSPIRELEFRRGEALLQLGRRLEAADAYRKETESFPDHRRAWLNYALVVGAQGRIEEARSILRAALDANPGESMRRGAREALQVMGDAEGLRQLGL